MEVNQALCDFVAECAKRYKLDSKVIDRRGVNLYRSLQLFHLCGIVRMTDTSVILTTEPKPTDIDTWVDLDLWNSFEVLTADPECLNKLESAIASLAAEQR